MWCQLIFVRIALSVRSEARTSRSTRLCFTIDLLIVASLYALMLRKMMAIHNSPTTLWRRTAAVRYVVKVAPCFIATTIALGGVSLARCVFVANRSSPESCAQDEGRYEAVDAFRDHESGAVLHPADLCEVCHNSEVGGSNFNKGTAMLGDWPLIQVALCSQMMKMITIMFSSRRLLLQAQLQGRPCSSGFGSWIWRCSAS